MLFITVAGLAFFAFLCLYLCYPCHPWFVFLQSQRGEGRTTANSSVDEAIR